MLRPEPLHFAVIAFACLGALPAHAADPPPPRATAAPVTPSTPAQLPGEQAFNSCVKVPNSRRVKVTLRPQSSLADLVGWISAMTCKRFIVPQSLAAQRVTLLAPTAIGAHEAYRAFVSALSVIGLTVVSSGRVLKVVPASWGVRSALPVYRHRQRKRVPSGDQMVTQILRVKQARVAQLGALLGRLKSAAGDVASWQPTNTLIITDSAANVRRMVSIVEALDDPLPGARIEVMTLRYADPAETARLLGSIFSGPASAGATASRRGGAARGRAASAASGGGPRFFAAGAARLIVVATPQQRARIRAVIDKVDVDDGGAKPKLWIYKLRHGDAESIAGALMPVAKGGGNGGARRPTRRTRRSRRGAARGANASTGAASLFEGDVAVGPDKLNNSLIIRATARDYIALRSVLREMDKPRPQVFVEAYILEIKLDSDRDVGVGYHFGGLPGESLVLGGVAHNGLNSAALNPLSLMGLAAGVQGPLVEGSGKALGLNKDIPAFGVIFRAMQTNGDLNVLSSPQLLTSDNQEAEILVGENIPLRSGAPPIPSGSGSDSNQLNVLSLVQPVVRQDVGLKLTVTPTIGAGDSVRLKIAQEASDIAAEDFGGLGAKTRKRTVRSTVVVHDQQTVVIGGLMRERESVTTSKVPLLGDIPLLGMLFRSTRTVREKTNLLLVLTPYIIRDKRDLQRILRRKMKERREFVRRYAAKHKRRDRILGMVDFTRRHGLLGEIARVGRQAERAAAAKTPPLGPAAKTPPAVTAAAKTPPAVAHTAASR